MQPTSCHLLRKRLISSSAGKTRQRLLDAAAETLNRRGIQGATTREIARLAGSRSHPFPPFQKQRAASPRHSQARADHAIRSPVHDARRAGTLKREHTPHSAKRVITTFIVALAFAFAVIVGLVYMINSEPATMYFPQNVNNRTFVPNYGERYRQGKTISTTFVESAVNEIVSKRFVRKTIDAVDGTRDQPLAANLHPGIEREPANDGILPSSAFSV